LHPKHPAAEWKVQLASANLMSHFPSFHCIPYPHTKQNWVVVPSLRPQLAQLDGQAVPWAITMALVISIANKAKVAIFILFFLIFISKWISLALNLNFRL
jgi:hypothetical protein